MNIDLGELNPNAIWQPAGTGPEKGYLMVILHGRGDSAEGWADVGRALKIPGLSYLLLNAPDDYYTGYSWYDVPPNQLPGITRSRALLEKVFTEIHRLGFPPEKCFLFGFSQGCLMTIEFGSRYPKRLAGYIGLSGYVYDSEAILKEVSPAARSGEWLVTHGTQDDVLPVERTREQVQELIAGGMKIEYIEYEKTHTLDTRDELPKIREWILERMKS